MKTLFNWLPAADKYHISGRGDVYAGPCPFEVDKSEVDWLDNFRKAPWVISHPDAKDKVFKVVGVESYAVSWIHLGQPVGLLVTEVIGAELDELLGES